MVKGKLLLLPAAVLGLLMLLGGCAGSPAPVEVSETESAQETTVSVSEYEKSGFEVFMDDGRLWVFRTDSEGLAEFKEKGEPAKQVIRPGAGPGGITLKAVDSGIIDEYLTTIPGFYTRMEDGRLWIFVEGSAELAEFLEKGEPAKQVVRPVAGPYGLTIKAVDGSVMDEYMTIWESM
jgi:hypothetical protein